MSMYIRVKRQRQTVFLTCEPTDTILSLKKKIEAINQVATDDQRLMMFEELHTYDEAKTLKECKLEDGGVVRLTYKTSSDPVEWEMPEIASPDDPAAPSS